MYAICKALLDKPFKVGCSPGHLYSVIREVKEVTGKLKFYFFIEGLPIEVTEEEFNFPSVLLETLRDYLWLRRTLLKE